MRPLGAAGGYVLALVAVCGFFLWTATGQRWENTLTPPPTDRREFQVRSDLLRPAEAVLDFFGDVRVIGVVLVALVVVALVTGRGRLGWAGVGVAVCSVGGARLLKELVPRPDLGIVHSTTHNSFPSGHAATAMGLLCAWLLVVPPRARWWVAIPGAVGVSVVSAATMVAGWHRVSDVTGGMLLASALCCLAMVFFARDKHVRPNPMAVVLLLVTPVPLTLIAAGSVFAEAIALASTVTALGLIPLLVLLQRVSRPVPGLAATHWASPPTVPMVRRPLSAPPPPSRGPQVPGGAPLSGHGRGASRSTSPGISMSAPGP